MIAKLALEILPPKQILASSFSVRHLFSLKKHFPLLARGFILGSGAFRLVPPSIFAKLLTLRSIHPGLWTLTKEKVEKYKALGLKVYPWVANTEEDFRKCAQLEVDGIFTDDPRLAKDVLR